MAKVTAAIDSHAPATQRAAVSILLPAWNAGTTIGSALTSIQRQSHANWACVVVDDGSTDHTAAVAAQFAVADARFHLVRTPHRGLVAALNEGLAHCNSPLIARMDADDVMHRDRLTRQSEALRSDSSIAAVGCHVRLFPRAALAPRLRDYETWLNSLRSADDVSRDAFVECPIAHPTLMMRGEMAQLQYCDNAWPEDYDFILRALASGFRIGVVPQRLLSWRDRPGSLSRMSPAYDVERFIACKAHYLARGFLSGSDQYVLWGYGDTGRLLRRALAAHGKTPTHIVEVKRTRLGQWIHGARVIPIDQLPSLRDHPVIVSVARAGPRSAIREALQSMRFVECRDFVCAA